MSSNIGFGSPCQSLLSAYAIPFDIDCQGYQGASKNGIPHGQGILRYPNGDCYEGEWMDGKRNGRGIYRISSMNAFYEGEWKDGKQHGQGTFTYSSGDFYEGEWKDGKQHGQGTLIYANGGCYKGEWKDGKEDGQGTYTYPSGALYEGEWKDGKRNGRGTCTYSIGARYEGEWKDEECHGQGTLTFFEGDRYEGEWKNGKPHGRGTYTYSSGDRYEGEWKDGEENDQGIYISVNGGRYEGKWGNSENILIYTDPNGLRRQVLRANQIAYPCLFDLKEICLKIFEKILQANSYRDRIETQVDALVLHLKRIGIPTELFNKITKSRQIFLENQIKIEGLKRKPQKNVEEIYSQMKHLSRVNRLLKRSRPTKLVNQLTSELARLIRNRISPIVNDLENAFKAHPTDDQTSINQRITEIFQAHFVSLESQGIEPAISTVLSKIESFTQRTSDPEKEFQEIKEKVRIVQEIAHLKKCSVEDVPTIIKQKFPRCPKDLSLTRLLDYQTILADIHMDLLLSKSGSKKNQGRKVNVPLRSSPQPSSSKSRKKKGSSTSVARKAPLKSLKASCSVQTEPCSSTDVGSSQSVKNPKSNLIEVKKKVALCMQLFRETSRYFLLPRVRRWETTSFEEIRQFTDRDSAGMVVQRYLSLSFDELRDQRARHYLPGLEKILSHAGFREVYSQQTSRGEAFWAELNYGDGSEFGLVYLGLDGGRIYHCYFEPTDASDDIFQLLKPDMDQPEPEENAHEGFIGIPKYEFSIDEQNILTVTYPKEKHSLRIYPLQEKRLQEMLRRA